MEEPIETPNELIECEEPSLLLLIALIIIVSVCMIK